jgi:hypothetical protein
MRSNGIGRDCVIEQTQLKDVKPTTRERKARRGVYWQRVLKQKRRKTGDCFYISPLTRLHTRRILTKLGIHSFPSYFSQFEYVCVYQQRRNRGSQKNCKNTRWVTVPQTPPLPSTYTTMIKTLQRISTNERD